MGQWSDPTCRWSSLPSWYRPCWAGRISTSSRAAANGRRRRTGAWLSLDRPDRAHGRDAAAIRAGSRVSPGCQGDADEPRESRPGPAEPELVFALAELSWIEAKRLERRPRPRRSTATSTPRYALDFLFDPAGRGPQAGRPAVPAAWSLQRRARPHHPPGEEEAGPIEPQRHDRQAGGPGRERCSRSPPAIAVEAGDVTSCSPRISRSAASTRTTSTDWGSR